ncbi:MAG: helix-turn-helix domain-containing protein [Deltaproteobacteria bacterium]|nr:helix-turn-helix domain-containing protein [Deltaproteobacteria bacterium]
MPRKRYNLEEEDEAQDLESFLAGSADDESSEAEDGDGEEGRAARARAALDRLAARIRALREMRGLTQDAFAERCHISVSFASLLERGERSPSYETLVQVAEALEVPLPELFRTAGEESPEDPYHGRLVEVAQKLKMGHAQVDRLVAVARALFAPLPSPPGAQKSRAGLACSAAGCDRPVLARGLCSSHYHKARRERGG